MLAAKAISGNPACTCRTSKDGETHISECEMKGFILKEFAQKGAPQCKSDFPEALAISDAIKGSSDLVLICRREAIVHQAREDLFHSGESHGAANV